MSFYLNPELADIWLVADNQKFPAHRVLLALKSNEMLKKFSQNPALKELRLNGCSPEALKSFLRFIYHNTYVWDRTLSTAFELMSLAKEFQVFELSLLVIEEITAVVENSNSWLSISSFGSMIHFIEEFKLKKLKLKVLSYGVQHVVEILQYEFMAIDSRERTQG